MVTRLVGGKYGTAALAYPSNDVSRPRQCALKILYSGPKFLVSLEFPIADQDPEHPLTFRYEGDNLVPGKTSLVSDYKQLSQASLGRIQRHGNAKYRKLSLTLKAPCSVWYPKNLTNKVSSLIGACEFLTLAKATMVDIIFDSNWISSEHLSILQGVVERSGQLVKIPVLPEFAKLHRQAKWSVFDSAQDAKSGVVSSIENAIAGAPSEDETDDAPPSYVSLGKHQRHNSTSLTPDPPLRKRLQEHATSSALSTPSPTPSSTDTVPVDVFEETIEKVVVRLLFRRLQSSSLPSPPRRNRSHRPVVKSRLGAELEKVLATTVNEGSEQLSQVKKSIEAELDDTHGDTISKINDEAEGILATFVEACNATVDEQKEEFLESARQNLEDLKTAADELVRRVWDRLDMVSRISERNKCINIAKDSQESPEQGRRTRSLPL